MDRIIFLDRDGVINNPKENYYVYKIEDFIVNKGMIEGLQTLRDRGFNFVIISNQGGISKEEFSIEDVDNFHDHLVSEFQLNGIDISAIYYCPHHDSIEKCLCRKPKALMLEKAIAKLNIDPKQSWFIGDKESDIEAGKRAGVNTILIKKNQDIREILDLISKH